MHLVVEGGSDPQVQSRRPISRLAHLADGYAGVLITQPRDVSLRKTLLKVEQKHVLSTCVLVSTGTVARIIGQ